MSKFVDWVVVVVLRGWMLGAALVYSGSFFLGGLMSLGLDGRYFFHFKSLFERSW